MGCLFSSGWLVGGLLVGWLVGCFLFCLKFSEETNFYKKTNMFKHFVSVFS